MSATNPAGATSTTACASTAWARRSTGWRARRRDPVRRHVPRVQRLQPPGDPHRRAERIRSIFVYTHDSIGLGEDGPTHQPIEHLMALRAIPQLCRPPGRRQRTAMAWRLAIERRDGPTLLAFSRQAVPHLARTGERRAEGVRSRRLRCKRRADGRIDAIIIGTGSEVGLAVEAQELLHERGVPRGS